MSHRQEINRSPPLSSFSHRAVASYKKTRKVKHIVSNADRAELERHYTFLPEKDQIDKWQDRMVQQYHSHLYKEYVLADLTRPGQVGLRWRTREEVESGRGHTTCGNKFCRSTSCSPEKSPKTDLLLRNYFSSAISNSEFEERKLLENIPFGLGLFDFEVPFTYVEQGESKEELVKLSLCLRCAPLLFQTKGRSDPALRARQARDQMREDKGREEFAFVDEGTNDHRKQQQPSETDSNNEDENQRRRDKKRRKQDRR